MAGLFNAFLNGEMGTKLIGSAPRAGRPQNYDYKGGPQEKYVNPETDLAAAEANSPSPFVGG